jgi:Holliday junction resolvasome RuvABC endonuclease subunit
LLPQAICCHYAFRPASPYSHSKAGIPTFSKDARVLALDPYYRGFGFAVLEGQDTLISWGTRWARINKNEHFLKEIARLIARYQPEAVVLEDYAGRKSHCSVRVLELIDGIKALAAKDGIPVRHFSRAEVRGAFASLGARTKQQIAAAIAGRFPELALRLPPVRKIWMPEDYRMSFFDAVAFAMTLFCFRASGKSSSEVAAKQESMTSATGAVVCR